jgi:rod shape-determining protein MreD
MTSDFSDRLLTEVPRKNKALRLRSALVVIVPLIAILVQVYLPRFFQVLRNLDLPLLVVVYFALSRRQPIAGTFIGAAIGLAQDSLSPDDPKLHPVGMFGIVNTLVGYFAASVSMRIDVDNPFIQFLLSFFFFVFHQFFFWVLARALLGQQIDFLAQHTLLFGLVNAGVALPLFIILDKIRE